jgi:hypothetical protein
MPLRIISAILILNLGLIGARTSVVPTPSLNELAARRLQNKDLPTLYFPAHFVCEIKSPDVCESSGLVRSARNPHLLWTHNDSGGEPAIVAFDRTGAIHGKVMISGATNRDWEEMTSFQINGESWLVVADSGNNLFRDQSVRLYFVREPLPDAKEVPYESILEFQFETGPKNCEAMAFDHRERKLIFVTKVSSGRCEIFELPLFDFRRQTTDVVAQRIASPNLSQVSGMCISEDGQRAVIINYTCGYEFSRRRDESWQTAFARTPRRIELDWRMPQREAVCFDEDDRSLLMTSEARQGFLKSLIGQNENITIPLWRVPASHP